MLNAIFAMFFKLMLNLRIKRLNYIFISFFCFVFLVRCVSPASPKKVKITDNDAIEKAQQFLIEQGYTNLPPSINKFKFEQGEFATDTLKILSYRKNTVYKKPFGIKHHGASLTIGFEYINKENNIGRAVTMDTLGVNIIMQTKEVRLDWFLEED